MARDDRDQRGGHRILGRARVKKGKSGYLACGCCPAYSHGTKEPLNRTARTRLWRKETETDD